MGLKFDPLGFATRGRNPMWIFTKYGFFSAVCARKGNGKHGQAVDPNRIMVRASEVHLTAIFENGHIGALLRRLRGKMTSGYRSVGGE